MQAGCSRACRFLRQPLPRRPRRRSCGREPGTLSWGAAWRRLGPLPKPPFLLPSPCPSSCSHREGRAEQLRRGRVGAGSRFPGAPVLRPGARRDRSAAAPASRKREHLEGPASRPGRRRPWPGPSLGRRGAGRHAETIFRPWERGCGKLELGERPRGAGRLRWACAGSLVTGVESAPRKGSAEVTGPSDVVEANSAVKRSVELRKDCGCTRSCSVLPSCHWSFLFICNVC